MKRFKKGISHRDNYGITLRRQSCEPQIIKRRVRVSRPVISYQYLHSLTHQLLHRFSKDAALTEFIAWEALKKP